MENETAKRRGKKMKKYEKVYKLVQKIPKGRVSTYGLLAKQLNMSPRVIGHALHLNPNSNLTPCHRVVDRTGRVAPGFAFGGPGIQKKLLEQEGILFKDESHVNLGKSLFIF